jgi:hypothetical protein
MNDNLRLGNNLVIVFSIIYLNDWRFFKYTKKFVYLYSILFKRDNNVGI